VLSLSLGMIFKEKSALKSFGKDLLMYSTKIKYGWRD
jgi:hypothetical protein